MTAPTALGRDLGPLLAATEHPWTADDLQAGDWIEFGPTPVITEAEIIEFAQKFDPLPIHIDPEAARKAQFGGVIASGMHTLSLYASISAQPFTAKLALYAGKGMDRMRLPRPVRPGSVLTGRIEVVGVQPTSDTRADVSLYATLVNQDGEDVMHLNCVYTLSRRA